MISERRSQYPRGLRCRSTAARLLRSWVRIPPGAWIFVCCECCVLSGRSLCDELITRPEGSYRLWCVVVCDLETSRMRRSWPALGRRATGGNDIWLDVNGTFKIWGPLTECTKQVKIRDHWLEVARIGDNDRKVTLRCDNICRSWGTLWCREKVKQSRYRPGVAQKIPGS